MPATKTICCAAFAIAISLAANGAALQFVDEKSVADGKVDIRPEFPAEAQAQRMEGAGVFVLHVYRNNGRVASVEVTKSTGHKILDDAAVAKFTKLQFKSHSVTKVTIPVEYKMPPPSNSITRGRGYPATALFVNQPSVVTFRGPAGAGRGK